jgi:hypothetical protein
MKQTVFMALSAIMLVSCSKDVINGSGSTITAERTVSNFTGIDISGMGKVYITYAPEISVTLKGYSNLIPHYVTDVNNNILYLHYENNTAVRNDNLEVHITMPYFTRLNMNGSSAIAATGDFDDTDNLNISTSGNGDISIEQFDTDLYSISSSGNSIISTLGVKAKTAKIDLSGNSTVFLSVSDKLEVKISGDGTVSYKGDPADLTSDISGNGTLIKL